MGLQNYPAHFLPQTENQSFLQGPVISFNGKSTFKTTASLLEGFSTNEMVTISRAFQWTEL